MLDLDALATLPVASIAAKDCVLFLWMLDSMPQQALDLIKAWRFVHKTTAFTWAKTTKDGVRFPFGCGYWTRANPETCLLATRGKPKRLDASVPQLIISPRRKHSEKPPETYEQIERLVAGPYAELFARGMGRRGWMTYGLEAGTRRPERQTTPLSRRNKPNAVR